MSVVVSNRVFIAPDRLIIADLPDLLLEHITKLTLISDSSSPLLRADYRLPDDPKLKHIGLRFFSDDVEIWAQFLHERTDVPLERLVGRKKNLKDG